MISRALMVLVVISSLSAINTLQITPKAMAETCRHSTISGSETTASTFENVTYGISSIQYPSDWTVNNTNKPAKEFSIFGNELNDSSIFNIVSFYAPARSYPKSQHLPSVSISINFPGDSQFVTSLSGYLNHTIYLYANGFTYDSTFQHMRSNSTSKLAGLPAYSLKYSDINSNDNFIATYTALELGTIRKKKG
jgi:hypothetical protein